MDNKIMEHHIAEYKFLCEKICSTGYYSIQVYRRESKWFEHTRSIEVFYWLISRSYIDYTKYVIPREFTETEFHTWCDNWVMNKNKGE